MEVTSGHEAKDCPDVRLLQVLAEATTQLLPDLGVVPFDVPVASNRSADEPMLWICEYGRENKSGEYYEAELKKFYDTNYFQS
jgi:hypothetical protein